MSSITKDRPYYLQYKGGLKAGGFKTDIDCWVWLQEQPFFDDTVENWSCHVKIFDEHSR